MADKKRKAEPLSDQKLFPIFVKKAKREDGPSGAAESSQAGSTASNSVQLTLQQFALLLDFSSVQTEQEIAPRLNTISQALLHDFRIVVRNADGKETEFQVMEAEFYLQIEAIHEDPFTHGSEEQKLSGRW